MTFMLALALAHPVLAADKDGDKKADKAGENAADKKAEIPPVTVTALVFAHYGLDLGWNAKTSTTPENSFDLDRAYLGAQSQMTEHLAAKVLFDANHLDDVSADSRFRVFVKNAWLEASNGKPVKARFGVVDTGYVPFEENFMGGRYEMKMFADDEKVLSTADIGLNFQGEASGGLLSYHAAILNGEGYSKPEVDAGKTLSGRLSVNPLSKSDKMALPITGFVSYAVPAKGAASVTDVVGALGLKVPHLYAWAEYVESMHGAIAGVKGVNSGGFSVQLSPRMPKYGGLLLRVDRFDPDQATDKDAAMKIFAGVNHDFLPKVSASLSYERTQPEVGDASHGIYARMQAGF